MISKDSVPWLTGSMKLALSENMGYKVKPNNLIYTSVHVTRENIHLSQTDSTLFWKKIGNVIPLPNEMKFLFVLFRNLWNKLHGDYQLKN